MAQGLTLSNASAAGEKRRMLCECYVMLSEFVGRDRPRQLALNGSTTEYHLKNVAHDTEYVLTLYVLFGSVVGPGITATFRTCEYLLSVSRLLARCTVEHQQGLE